MPIHQISKIKNSILRSEQLFHDNRPIKLVFPTVSCINCYAYSLGIMYPCEDDEDLYFPGFTQSLRYERINLENLMNMVALDLQNLEIPFRLLALEDNKQLRQNEYLIKIFFDESPFRDFHFVRQDKHTGIWFHKMGWQDQPEMIHPIYSDEPTLFRLGLRVYHPVGYFAITESKP